MLYFNDFPNVGYKFGDEVDETIFQNISVYAEVIDQIKSEVTCNRKKADDWKTNIKKFFQLQNLGHPLSQLYLA